MVEFEIRVEEEVTFNAKYNGILPKDWLIAKFDFTQFIKCEAESDRHHSSFYETWMVNHMHWHQNIDINYIATKIFASLT